MRPGSRSSTAAPFLYEVVDLDHGPVGCRRTWGGAEELAHQYADLRDAALASFAWALPGAGGGLAGRSAAWRP